MIKDTLTDEDWEMILESLKYSKLKFEEYDQYTSIEFKKERVEAVSQLIAKIKALKK